MFSYLVEDNALDTLMAEYIDYLDESSSGTGIESASLGTIRAVYK